MLDAQAPDRSKPPAPGPVPGLSLPKIQHFTVAEGIPVVLLEKHNLPLVQVEVTVHAGIAADPEGKPGVASLTATMMQEGAGSRNSLEFADAVDYLGASLSAYSGWHTSGVSLHCSVRNLDSALTLLGDMILSPRFPADELERKRKELLTSLSQWHDEPSAIASVLFHATLYGTDHPYGIPIVGNELSIRSITTGDLKNFHETYFRPNNATIIVVGDVTPEKILPKLNALFADWKPAPVTIPVRLLTAGRQPRTIYLVDKPGAAQSEIMIGMIGVDRATPDYFALQVMNDILGGAFTSRLNQNLRETHGYTYGAGSYFDMRVQPGPFVARAAVQTAVTDKALGEFMHELTSISGPIQSEELTRAKNYLTLRYPANFQSVERIASRLAEIVTYNLPDDYFNTYSANIMNVGLDDARRVAGKYILPDSLTIVVVGDRSVIGKGITDLHLAPVHSSPSMMCSVLFRNNSDHSCLMIFQQSERARLFIATF